MFDYAIEDWEQSPIVDVISKEYQQGSDPVCPEFYEPIAFVDFAGTKEGCKCGSQMDFGAVCSSNQKDDGCKSVNAIEP